MTTPRKKLKLALAMGGGVSLGAFSGAAVTESLKQLLLFGQDEDGQYYSDLEIDAMSGASAGAMSLLVMVLCLLDYRRYIKDFIQDYSGQTPALWEMKEVIDRLETQFGEEMMIDLIIEDPDRLESLYAIEVAQMLQHKLWVEEISMTGLIPLDILADTEKSNFSLLSREKLLDIVEKYVLLGIEHINLSHARLLNVDRFLFVCSLTGLLPTQLRASKWATHDYPLVHELHKAHASFNHKELRIFDFQLGANPSAPPMPKAINIRAHGSPSATTLALTDVSTWARVAATCIACGAFPIAFEPVILERFKHELQRPISTGRPLRRFSVSDSMVRPDTLRFSYVDGGTLNNEPINEAFSLASFMDLRSRDRRSIVDRVVLFVDPIVRTTKLSNNSPDFYRHTVRRTADQLHIDVPDELDRFGPYTSRLIRLLRNQGAIKEEHRTSDYLEKHLLYAELSTKLRDLPMNAQIDQDFITSVYLFITYHHTYVEDQLILTFDIDDPFFLIYTIHSYQTEYGYPQHEIGRRLDKLTSIVDQLLHAIEFTKDGRLDVPSSILAYTTILDGYEEDIPFVKKLLYDLTLRLLMKIDDKDQAALRLSITPVQYSSSGETVMTVDLPGAEFEAFGGFTNITAREYSSQYARYCAFMALRRSDFRQYYQERMLHSPSSVQHMIGADMIDEMGTRSSAFHQQVPYFNTLVSIDDPKPHAMIRSTLSPLRTEGGAKRYLRDIKTDMYERIRDRLIQILWDSVIPRRTAVILLGLTGLFILLFPIAIVLKTYWIQLWLVTIYVVILLALIVYLYTHLPHLGWKGLEEKFNYHIFPQIKIEWTAPGVEAIRYYRLDDEGPYHRVAHTDRGAVTFALPYFMKYDHSAPDNLNNATWHTLKVVRVSKPFNTNFDIITSELLDSITLHKITFYRKKGRPLPNLQFNMTAFHKTQYLKMIARYISPYVVCEGHGEHMVTPVLRDSATPLWQELMQRRESNQTPIS